jgi:hypothetical protein
MAVVKQKFDIVRREGREGYLPLEKGLLKFSTVYLLTHPR